MKKMMHQQRGYILFITFSMLALCTALVSVFMVKALTHKKLAQAVLEQEITNQFLLSMPTLGQSFLSFSADDMKSQEKKPEAAASDKQAQPVQDQSFSKKLLEKVLPVVNKQQKFMMKEMEKDFPVVINLTFFCESGKINVNGLYDLVNKKFYNEGVEGKDQKKFATWLFDKIATLTDKPSLLQPFIEHVKQRKEPFNDVTQLLAIKEFATCFQDAIFYEQQKEQTDKKAKKLFLTDLFTVTSESDTIQPWLLSPSVCVLLDIAQKGSKQQESEKKEDDKVDLSSFKEQADWQKDWDVVLKPRYDVSYDTIPETFRNMLSTHFSASIFSMIATVKQETVVDESDKTTRVFAILKEKKLSDNSITYDVIKIYQV